MSHEQSITVGMDNKFYNLPTVINGKKVSNDEAVKLFREGKIKPLGEFEDEPNALKAARERSESFGHEHLENNRMWIINFLKSLLGL